MNTQSFCRRTRSCAQLPLVLLALILAGGAAAGTDDEYIPTCPSDMLAMEKYYNIENTDEAAAVLRRDAARFGLDVDEHPQVDKVDGPYVDDPHMMLNLHVVDIRPDVSDRSYLSTLAIKNDQAGETNEYVAILAVTRVLSIDEVAGIFESGIYILEKLYAGSRHENFGGYIVQGPAEALVGLQNRDYFLWLGEYSANLKMRANRGPSSIDMYVIKLFKMRIEHKYVSDIESHGAALMSQSELFRSIRVQCSWDTALKLCELDWVRSIRPLEPAEDGALYQSGSPVEDGDKSRHNTALAQNSRILAGSDGYGNGSGVNVGVIDRSLAYQDGTWSTTHPSLSLHYHYLQNATSLNDTLLHGTAVTSLILGSAANFTCTDGKVETAEGMAPLSMFSFLSNRIGLSPED